LGHGGEKRMETVTKTRNFEPGTESRQGRGGGDRITFPWGGSRTLQLRQKREKLDLQKNIKGREGRVKKGGCLALALEKNKAHLGYLCNRGMAQIRSKKQANQKGLDRGSRNFN